MCTFVYIKLHSNILQKDSNSVCKFFSLFFCYSHKASNHPWNEGDWSSCAAVFQVGILYLLFEGHDLREFDQLQTIKESPRKIPLWTFTLASSSFPDIKIVCQLSILLDKRWNMLSATPHISMDFLFHKWGTILQSFW